MGTPTNNKINQKSTNSTNSSNGTNALENEILFRRKEDQIKYDITNKILGIVKWLIAFNLVLLYFFYSVTNDNKILIEYQMRMINDIGQKIGRVYPVVNNESILEKEKLNYKIFETSLNANKCASCHNSTRNTLFVPAIWDFEDFKKYVRGEFRVPSNTIMPKYTEKDITTKELETLYLELIK